MCLGLPGRVVEIREYSAIVDIAGTKREVSTMMLGEDIAVGDYVMVHVGFAIAKMDSKEAEKTLKTILEYIDETDQ